jgi:hypothetical protein
MGSLVANQGMGDVAGPANRIHHRAMRCIITAHALRQLTEILSYCLPHLFHPPAHLFEALFVILVQAGH